MRSTSGRSRTTKTRNVEATKEEPGEKPAATRPEAAPARRRTGSLKVRRGYAGRSAEQLREERKRRLLDAALTLFAERGFAKTPIELLCAQARVTTRHFYEQFQGREAVLAVLYQETVSNARNAVLQALQQGGQTTQLHMFNAIHAFIRSYTDDPRRARIACIEVVGVNEEISELRRKMINEFSHVLEAYALALAKTGTLPRRDYHLGALCMVGGTNELLTEWLTSKNPPTIAELTEQLLRFYSALFVGARALGPTTPSFDFAGLG